jgi:hypothetical protein
VLRAWSAGSARIAHGVFIVGRHADPGQAMAKMGAAKKCACRKIDLPAQEVFSLKPPEQLFLFRLKLPVG